jgi:hypothetical protein
MTVMTDDIEHWKWQIQSLKTDLACLESGRSQDVDPFTPNKWVDFTSKKIVTLKRKIAELERRIEGLKKRMNT